MNEVPQQAITPEGIARQIQNWFDSSRRAKERLHETWLRNYRHWRGLERDKAPRGRSMETINVIFPTCEQKVALLGDSKPGFVIYPQEGNDVHTADAIQSLVGDYLRDITEMEEHEEMIRLDASLCGSGLGMYYWSTGESEIGFKRVDPFTAFPAPGAREINQGRYFIIAEAVSTYELRRRWPKAKNVKGDGKLLEAIAYDRSEAGRSDSINASEAVKQTEEMVLVLFCWWTDDAYPKGRFSVVAGNELLHDGENPLPVEGRPFVKFDWVADPAAFWGVSEVEHLIDPAKMVNKRKNQIQDATDLNANGRIMVDVNKVPEWKKITGKPREVIPVQGNPKNAIHTDYGSPLPGQVFADLQDSLFWINLISGLQDVGRGVIPKGDPSGAALQTIMESVNIRVRKVARSWERFLKRSALMAIDMLQLYTNDKLFAILNPDTAEVEYIKADDLKLDTRYNVRVRAGSTLPTNRTAKLSLAIQLVNNNIIPPQVAIELLDLPEVKVAMQKMQQAQAAMASAAPQPVAEGEPTDVPEAI